MTTLPEDHQKLMDVVRILDKHFGGLISIARRQMLNAQHRGKFEEADSYRTILNELRGGYDDAIEVVADKITQPEKLKIIKRKLRDAADTGFAFLQELKETKAALENLDRVANYISDLISTLRAI